MHAMAELKYQGYAHQTKKQMISKIRTFDVT